MKTEQGIRSQIAKLRLELRQLKAKRIGTVVRKGRGSRDRDEELRAQRGYTNPASYVRGSDSSERLIGEDWRKRKEELRERSGGQCEFMLAVEAQLRCSNKATIPAHVNPRYPRRDDRLSNLKHYCFIHDRMMERQSWRKPRFGEWN